MATRHVVMIMLLALLLGGCATKRYGRMTTLSEKEAEYLSCQGIDDEIVECEVFLADVISTGFSGADVAAILGDYGIGNMMERDAALKSGKTRLKSLYQLREAKCGVPMPEDWLASVKREAEILAEEKEAERKRLRLEAAKGGGGGPDRRRSNYRPSTGPVEEANPWEGKFGATAKSPPARAPAPSAVPADAPPSTTTSTTKMTAGRWKSSTVEERMAWCREAVKLIGTDMTPEQLYVALDAEIE